MSTRSDRFRHAASLGPYLLHNLAQPLRPNPYPTTEAGMVRVDVLLCMWYFRAAMC